MQAESNDSLPLLGWFLIVMITLKWSVHETNDIKIL